MWRKQNKTAMMELCLMEKTKVLARWLTCQVSAWWPLDLTLCPFSRALFSLSLPYILLAVGNSPPHTAAYFIYEEIKAKSVFPTCALPLPSAWGHAAFYSVTGFNQIPLHRTGLQPFRVPLPQPSAHLRLSRWALFLPTSLLGWSCPITQAPEMLPRVVHRITAYV